MTVATPTSCGVGDAPPPAISSSQTKSSTPSTAGQRPSQSGYLNGAGCRLARNQPEASGDEPAQRAPRVEGPEDVPEENAEQDQAQPERVEDEDDGEVLRRVGDAAEARVEDDHEQPDADRSAEDLGARVEHRAGEPSRDRPPVLLLQARRGPGDREQRERDDQDERGPPGEEPGRHRQVLAAHQRVRGGDIREQERREEPRRRARSGESPRPLGLGDSSTSRVDVQLRDRSLRLVEAVDLDLEDPVEVRREREGVPGCARPGFSIS